MRSCWLRYVVVVVDVKEEDEVDKAALLPRGMRSAKFRLVPNRLVKRLLTIEGGAEQVRFSLELEIGALNL